MRTITLDELPDDLQCQVVIKSSERSRHHRMASALERTLSRCSEVHAEAERRTAALRENYKKQAFQAGFTLIFDQLVLLLDEYQRQQIQRQAVYRRHIATALKKSLNDPMIVERIIHHLQEQCGHQKALRIIIPRAVKLPEGSDTSNYQFTDDNHITVQNDRDAVRFPCESLCREWLLNADENIAPLNDTINNLTPELLRDLAGKLIALSQQCAPAPLNAHQDEQHE